MQKIAHHFQESYIEADKCGLSNNDFKCEIQALSNILSDYKRVLKENKELENITDKMIDYIMMHQQVKTMRKIFCKHCKLQNSCTYSGIHRNCVIRYFEYISKQGNISKMHENLEKILESEE